MGTAGFKWAGRNPNDDCSMLWGEAFGLTNADRTVLASVFVFLLAVLAQYLTTAEGNQQQQSKAFAKRRHSLSLFPGGDVYYDPELGNGVGGSGCKPATMPPPPCLKANGKTANGAAPHCKHAAAAEAEAMQSVVHPEMPDVMRPLTPKITTVSTATRTGNGHRAHPTATAMLLPPPVLSVRSVATIAADAPAMPSSVKVSNWVHLGDALMRGLRIFLAYLLMLAVMTYDLTLVVSIVAGFMAGFFVFAKDTAKVPASADPCCS
ncbi:hypothetical protein BBJ28_00003296 [Nothophytophthora sp. Chile5]|nr:hypothetical protein BBJ28_00003296 [Nothophytophthora sp. Chile5]